MRAEIARKVMAGSGGSGSGGAAPMDTKDVKSGSGGSSAAAAPAGWEKEKRELFSHIYACFGNALSAHYDAKESATPMCAVTEARFKHFARTVSFR